MTNCQQVQATLDAGRPDGRDWQEAELRAAAAHWESCPVCRAAMRERQEWDAAISEVLGDVLVPEGLPGRILSALAADVDGASPVAAPVDRQRRRWRWWISGAAVAAAIACGVWLHSQSDAGPLPLETVMAKLIDSLPAATAFAGPELTAFDGSFAATATDPVWSEALHRVAAQGLDLDGRPGHDAAVYHVDQRRVRGWLVVLPRDRVVDAPAATLPSHTTFRYGPRPQVTWSSPEHVYVCVLDRGTLDDLLREFYGRAA